MNKNIIDKFLEKHNLSDVEKDFVKESSTAMTADMNQSQVVTNIYFAKTLESAADRIEKSNTKHTRWMIGLTAALVVVGILGIILSNINKINL